MIEELSELWGRTSDIAALVLFLIIWFAYEPILRALAAGRQLINADMLRIRSAWMNQMSLRPGQRLLDSQLIGHALNSASFFASSNLILIAAAAGVLFGGDAARRKLETAPLLAHAPRGLFELKLALVAVTLARGLLSFIWAIRQLNYCVAVVGAAPVSAPAPTLRAYGKAAAAVINPAMHSFNAGVRGYYFALSATAWLAGPIAFEVTTLGAIGLLGWRQSFSPAARAVRSVRAILDEVDQAEPAGSIEPAKEL